MLASLSSILGGLGLFLLGMALMTEGLTTLAGASLRRQLATYTNTRRRAVLSGAGVTAIVQSSSATTLATIGFVSAGLLSFESAIGVVIGANIGTTSTGWLVSLLGLKLSISKLALPLVGVGALMRLLGRGRKAHMGTAIAGFGLIFVGIDALQAGMEGLSEYLDPADYALPGVGGRLVLVLVGVLMTVVMQSSSAAVATTLTALAGGALNLDQAAALVVGQNVGTTVTALIAAVGASVPAKRTALVHVIFNLTTGTIAFALLPVFTYLVTSAMARVAAHDQALTLAAFHTAFNLLGALIFLPLTPLVATWVQRVIREKESDLTRHLHRGLQHMPDMAVAAARDALAASAALALKVTAIRMLGGQSEVTEVREALRKITEFMGNAETAAGSEPVMQRRIAVLHALDNLSVVLDELDEPLQLDLAIQSSRTGPELKRMSASIEHLRARLEQDGYPDAIEAEAVFTRYAEEARLSRQAILADMAAGRLKTTEAMLYLAVQRWVERVLKHLWRAFAHLEMAADKPVQTAVEENSESSESS